MVLLPLKSISTQSLEKSSAVLSFQPPPLPQLAPLRSPSLTALSGKAGLKAPDEVATPPLLAKATFSVLPTCTDETRASVRLDGIRRQQKTPVHKTKQIETHRAGAKRTKRFMEDSPFDSLTQPKAMSALFD